MTGWVRTSLAGAIFLFTSAADAQGAPDRASLPDVVRPCAVCHGESGISKYPNIPHLAGQKIEYLLKQTTLMRDSARRRLGEISGQDPPFVPLHSERLAGYRDFRDMDRQMAALDEGGILDISAFFASRPRTCVQPAANKNTPPALAKHCAKCHGQNGISSDPNIPDLAGQQQFYLLEQLRRFRATGQELDPAFINSKRYCATMSPQMGLITREQLTALAAWFATAPCEPK